MKKYALYIGRWQNWHKGHEWLINQQLEKGKNCWVAIRDVQKEKRKNLGTVGSNSKVKIA